MVPGRSQTIFLLVSDQRIGDGLERACRAQGFSPIVGATVSDIGSRLGGSPPAPVILHTAALPTDKDLAEVLDYFAWVAERRIPTLVLATEDDLQMRLAARRAGCIGFHLLPISDSDLAEILAPFSGDDRLSQERVLVVDDVKVEAMISGQILRKAGYDVLELCNELEIIDRIRSFHPDLILMDLNMPNASGSELTAIIRDHADMLLTPIVFLSGEQDAAAQREAMRLGADEFLSKPVSPQNLVATVRARIKRSRGIQRRFAPADETDALTHTSRSESACSKALGAKPGRASVYGAAKPADTSGQTPPPEQTELNGAPSGLKAEIRYSPLLALSARVRPARRYQVSAWLPNDVQVDPDAATLAPRPATDPIAERNTEDSDRAHWLDYQSMERALDQLAADRNNRGAMHDPKPMRLFVPQSIATVIHREWVLWMRDRLLERQLLGYAPLVVLRAEDLLAHLGVASALFRLLEQLQVEVCLERLNTEPATLSLLTSFPLAYAAVDPALLQAKESRTPLIKLVDAAHAQHVPLIASDIDDEETLARVRQCGVDLVAGTFIQAPSISMDFAFEPCGEGA